MHINNVTLAVMVDGKSLYENKQDVFIPFGSEYELFVKNNNTFDIVVKVSPSLFHSDQYLIKAKSKKTIKGFSEDEIFYAFRFVEHIKEIKENKSNAFVNSILHISIYKKEDPLSILQTRRIGDVKPLVGSPFDGSPIEVLINNQKNKNNTFYSSTNSIDSSFSSVGNNEGEDLLSGIQTYGKPVEGIQEYHYTDASIPIANFSFNFLGVDESGNRLLKPLFAKDIINCKVCNSKSKPDATYCSKCGSFIVKTAALIDNCKHSEKKCCGKVWSNDFQFCPICSLKLN